MLVGPEGAFEARNGQVSTFSASFNPIFLWELAPKLLLDSRLEIEPSGGGTNVVKAAYEWDDPDGEPNKNALLLQAAMGF